MNFAKCVSRHSIMKPSLFVLKGSPISCSAHPPDCVIGWTGRKGTEDVTAPGRSLGSSRDCSQYGRSGSRVCWVSLLASGTGTRRFVGPVKKQFRGSPEIS
jgi:hypothetical protein